MKKILNHCVLVLCSAGMVSVPALASAETSQEMLVAKLTQQTQSLQAEVRQLQADVGAIHEKKTSSAHLVKQTPVNTTTKSQAKQTATKTLQYTGGSPVTTSPYLGVTQEFDGSHLIVNKPSINEDTRLLKQRQAMTKDLKQKGETMVNHPLVELSGKIEGQVSYARPYKGAKTSDVDVSGAELDAMAEINSWTTGLLALSYDNGAPDTAMKITRRINNSRLFVNKAFITVGNLEKTPFYSTLGQLYVPFGRYSSLLITAPMTMVMARTKARTLIAGYQHQGDTGAFGSVYAYKGESHVGNNGGKVNSGGVNLGYNCAEGAWSVESAVGLNGNIADSEGMQDTGGANGSGGFAGFGTSTNEDLFRRVPAADVYATVGYGDYMGIGEFVMATKRFSSRDMTYNNHGARPKALHLEVAKMFEIGGKASSVSLAYGATRQALGLYLPKTRYGAVFNYSPVKDTVLALEFRHDVNYGKSATAKGKNSLITQGEANRGKSSDAVTAQFGVYF